MLSAKRSLDLLFAEGFPISRHAEMGDAKLNVAGDVVSSGSKFPPSGDQDLGASSLLSWQCEQLAG